MAVLAGLFAGLCWGIFWVPLRMVEQAGFDAPWAMAVFTTIPALLCLPLLWRFRDDYRKGWALLGGILGGVAYALYAASLLYTDVVRAVLLFYLMPIWGFLLGWVVLGDRMTWYRWLAIALGISGMLVVFADDTGLPLPRVWGDWFGLASGVFWAVGCTLILTEKRVRIATQATNFFVMAALVSVGVAVLATWQGIAEVPQGTAVGKLLVWFLPVALLLILPGGFASIYAPSRLNPGLVGLLFMTEIVVAVLTAAIWAGEAFGLREAVGVALILSAGLIEPVVAMRVPQPQA
ncbi:MAG: DMT family transporter [Pseudomonadota bacterium]